MDLFNQSATHCSPCTVTAFLYVIGGTVAAVVLHYCNWPLVFSLTFVSVLEWVCVKAAVFRMYCKYVCVCVRVFMRVWDWWLSLTLCTVCVCVCVYMTCLLKWFYWCVYICIQTCQIILYIFGGYWVKTYVPNFLFVWMLQEKQHIYYITFTVVNFTV